MKRLLLIFACLSLPLAYAGSTDGAVVETGRQVFLNAAQLDSAGVSSKTASSPVDTLTALLGENARIHSSKKKAVEGATVLEVVRRKTDKQGQSHTKIRQVFNGLPIEGSQIIVHTDNDGKVRGINGMFAKTEGLALVPTVEAEKALKGALAQAEIQDAKVITRPKLTYVMDQNGEAFLAWSAEITYEGDDMPMRDILFADATGQSRFERHPQHHSTKLRFTFDAENVLLEDPELFLKLPGTLKRSEGEGPVADVEVNNAHEFAGDTYDYYLEKFGRDSYDNAGAPLISSVHLGVNLNNAFWTGGQMVYGDGDGVFLLPLSSTLDVVAHELTHAVTQNESNLIYFNESGALNEAWSDIFGIAAGVHKNNGQITEGTWLQGEEIFTPGIEGDAFRYMHNPTLDGFSRDYYPERYIGPWDNGGVHINSGIANLAFYLLVEGGPHPRAKTDVVVTGIGMDKAEQIFYRAQTTYLTPSSNFEAARYATANAAADLYGAAEVATIHDIWDAVGVPRTWALQDCYVAGRTVNYNGVAYRCLQSHCAYAENWNPESAPSLWVGIAPDTTADWTVNTEYVLGALATYEGEVYRCISAHISVEGWEPPQTSALWVLNQ